MLVLQNGTRNEYGIYLPVVHNGISMLKTHQDYGLEASMGASTIFLFVDGIWLDIVRNLKGEDRRLMFQVIYRTFGEVKQKLDK
jgi:hypothetical protein